MTKNNTDNAHTFTSYDDVIRAAGERLASPGEMSSISGIKVTKFERKGGDDGGGRAPTNAICRVVDRENVHSRIFATAAAAKFVTVTQ